MVHTELHTWREMPYWKLPPRALAIANGCSIATAAVPALPLEPCILRIAFGALPFEHTDVCKWKTNNTKISMLCLPLHDGLVQHSAALVIEPNSEGFCLLLLTVTCSWWSQIPGLWPSDFGSCVSCTMRFDSHLAYVCILIVKEPRGWRYKWIMRHYKSTVLALNMTYNQIVTPTSQQANK